MHTSAVVVVVVVVVAIRAFNDDFAIIKQDFLATLSLFNERPGQN